jgi:glycosyltransferase involved in cell wall biosynthesis
MTRVDVVVAVRDEEHNISRFLDGIASLAISEGVDLRVLFVEDSSTDGTRALLRRLSGSDPRVAYCSLVRGFGQGPAIAFGLARSRADAMIMMDVDGSHPVAAIPEILSAFLGGARIVQCVRRNPGTRRAYRRFGSAVVRWAGRLFSGIDMKEQNIYYRLVDAEMARDLLRHPRYLRFLRMPLPRKPDGVLAKVHVDCEERAVGESKYDFFRLAGLALDGLLSLISPARFAALLVLLGAAALPLFLVGLWPLAIAAGLGATGLAVGYIRLQHDVLERIEVSECGGWLTEAEGRASQGN